MLLTQKKHIIKSLSLCVCMESDADSDSEHDRDTCAVQTATCQRDTPCVRKRSLLLTSRWQMSCASQPQRALKARLTRFTVFNGCSRDDHVSIDSLIDLSGSEMILLSPAFSRLNTFFTCVEVY